MGYCVSTPRRIENHQIGVFLAHAVAKGRTLLERELYLPQVWTQDWGRYREGVLHKKVIHFLAGLASGKGEVNRRCRTVLQSGAEGSMQTSRPAFRRPAKLISPWLKCK